MPDAPKGDAGDLRPVADLAGLSPEELLAALRPLFEDARPLAAALSGRTFGTWPEVIDAASEWMATATAYEKEQLLASHPRLGESAQSLRLRSRASWSEQGGGADREASITAALAAANDRYEERMGFPFVEWVAGRPLDAMVRAIEERTGNRREDELTTGCAALIAIALDRLERYENRARPPGQVVRTADPPTIRPDPGAVSCP